jgi:hypothetical protein
MRRGKYLTRKIMSPATPPGFVAVCFSASCSEMFNITPKGSRFFSLGMDGCHISTASYTFEKKFEE